MQLDVIRMVIDKLMEQQGTTMGATVRKGMWYTMGYSSNDALEWNSAICHKIPRIKSMQQYYCVG